MSAQQNLVALSTPRKIFLGAAVLLFIDSFLPWYHVSAGPFSASLSDGTSSGPSRGCC